MRRETGGIICQRSAYGGRRLVKQLLRADRGNEPLVEEGRVVQVRDRSTTPKGEREIRVVQGLRQCENSALLHAGCEDTLGTTDNTA